ncbi:MAG TPA: CesT family type III secretion system chaperone [Rhabdochlamydiaceae bacterium]|nr:CesT family type III secretion system chaperone [Rhabdochlamydiaceae bacterium]
MDHFAILLADLGALIQVPLHPDHHRACNLVINGELHVQLKEEDKDRILVAAFISEIPAGKFREHILLETLKENTLFPRTGNFCYSERNNQLAMYAYVYFPGLDGDTMADFLEKFLEKAFSWKTALQTGQLPERGHTLQKTGPSIFDIKRK